MDLGPHAGFIVTAYITTAAVVAALVCICGYMPRTYSILKIAALAIWGGLSFGIPAVVFFAIYLPAGQYALEKRTNLVLVAGTAEGEQQHGVVWPRGAHRALSSCTAFTIAATFSTGVSGKTPWPR